MQTNTNKGDIVVVKKTETKQNGKLGVVLEVYEDKSIKVIIAEINVNGLRRVQTDITTLHLNKDQYKKHEALSKKFNNKKLSADSNNTPVYGIWSKDGAEWTLLYQYPCTSFFPKRQEY